MTRDTPAVRSLQIHGMATVSAFDGAEAVDPEVVGQLEYAVLVCIAHIIQPFQWYAIAQQCIICYICK